MATVPTYDGDFNLKATELRLALPGSDDEPKQATTTNSSMKRSSEDFESSPSSLVGWPPVQSYRKKNRFGGLYVKVDMDGAPYMRKIDLKACKSYVELMNALESMLKVKIGEREGYRESEYEPIYEDKDGDWMLVGDVPWDMFVSTCKRIKIIKNEASRLRMTDE